MSIDTYRALRKFENQSEMLNCHDKETGSCKKCSNFTSDKLTVFLNPEGSDDLNSEVVVSFDATTPLYADDEFLKTKPQDIDDKKEYWNKNLAKQTKKTKTRALQGACKIKNKDTLQKLRCYCDYVMSPEILDASNFTTPVDTKGLWDILTSKDGGLKGVITHLDKKLGLTAETTGNTKRDRKEVANQVLGLMCKVANTTNPREAYDKSAMPLIRTIRLTGWVSNNTISLIANLIFFILNILFFSAFVDVLSGNNTEKAHMILPIFKIGYQVFLFIVSSMILAVVLGGAISKDSFVNTGDYLLTIMTYSSVFACIIVLFLLFFSIVQFRTYMKRSGRGALQILLIFAIIAITAITVLLYLFMNGKAPSSNTLVVVGLFGFFIIGVAYVKGYVKKSIGDNVNSNGVNHRTIGLIAFSILILETLFGLFFPYLYFLIILMLRLATGAMLKSTFWTLIPFYITSIITKASMGNSNGKVDTMVGVTDYQLFKDNFITKSEMGVVGKIAIFILMVTVFAILLIMGV
jgi:hypothetical protein